MHASMGSPKRLQLVHAAPHATKFVLLTLVFEVISEVTEHTQHSNTARLRWIDEQLQGMQGKTFDNRQQQELMYTY